MLSEFKLPVDLFPSPAEVAQPVLYPGGADKAILGALSKADELVFAVAAAFRQCTHVHPAPVFRIRSVSLRGLQELTIRCQFPGATKKKGPVFGALVFWW